MNYSRIHNNIIITLQYDEWRISRVLFYLIYVRKYPNSTMVPYTATLLVLHSCCVSRIRSNRSQSSWNGNRAISPQIQNGLILMPIRHKNCKCSPSSTITTTNIFLVKPPIQRRAFEMLTISQHAILFISVWYVPAYNCHSGWTILYPVLDWQIHRIPISPIQQQLQWRTFLQDCMELTIVCCSWMHFYHYCWFECVRQVETVSLSYDCANLH